MIKEIVEDSVKVGGGFAVAGFAGRYVEDMFIKTPVTSASAITDKLMAWAANNAPKIAGYIVLNRVGMTKDVAKGMLGSFVVDSLARVSNNGPNPLNLTIAGYRFMSNGERNVNVQTLIKENSSMRTQLNETLKKIALNSNNINNIEKKSLFESKSELPTVKPVNSGILLNTPTRTATLFGMK